MTPALVAAFLLGLVIGAAGVLVGIVAPVARDLVEISTDTKKLLRRSDEDGWRNRERAGGGS